MKYKGFKVKNPVEILWDHGDANTGDRIERQEMIPYFSAKFGPLSPTR